MPEYQPQWTLPKKSANPTRNGTDSTDGLLRQRETVSSDSAPLGPTRDVFPTESKAKGGLTAADAAALGLDPALQWVNVYTGPVEATRPHADWDGTLPEGCGWPALCSVLGPCPRRQVGGPCRTTGDAS
jgi:hypothetical protein